MFLHMLEKKLLGLEMKNIGVEHLFLGILREGGGIAVIDT